MPLASALVIGGSSVVSGFMGSRGARKASRAMADAQKYAADLQQKRYEQTREDYAPYRQVGSNALYSLANLSGQSGRDAQAEALRAFETSPGYQFRLDQGTQAIERSNAASGLLNSGATLQDLTRFGQGIGSDEYGRYTNRLAALAGVGQTATNSLANLGATYAANQGNAIAGMGQARASGYEGQANAWGNALGNLAGVYGMYQSGGFGNPGYQVPADITANQNALNSFNYGF